MSISNEDSKIIKIFDEKFYEKNSTNVKLLSVITILIGLLVSIAFTTNIFSLKAKADTDADTQLIMLRVRGSSIELTEDASYENPETGYYAYILDGADYISDTEEEKLISLMAEITDYANVIYVTDEHNLSYSESYSDSLAEEAAHYYFSSYDPVVVYVCDNEYDYVYSQGRTQKTITSSKAYSITDNVYRYSAEGAYYKAAEIAFTQINTLLEGDKIAEPMKYICNAFVALFIGFIVCYLIVSKKSKLKYASYSDMLYGAISWVDSSPTQVYFINKTRTYSPRSSGSGGGGGGGGRGGGGGHSGGGHSH